jgi:hypothetical protein
MDITFNHNIKSSLVRPPSLAHQFRLARVHDGHREHGRNKDIHHSVALARRADQLGGRFRSVDYGDVCISSQGADVAGFGLVDDK